MQKNLKIKENIIEKNKFIFALGIIIIFAVVGAGISIVFGRFVSFSDTSADVLAPKKTEVAGKIGAPTAQAGGAIAFNPPSVQDAPANIKDAVMLGHNILTDTGKYAGQYVGNKLDLFKLSFQRGHDPRREKRRPLACGRGRKLSPVQEEAKLFRGPRNPDK